MLKPEITFEGEELVADRRLYSAACERNREALLGVLQTVFPKEGRVIEIAAGTGMHALHFSRNLPGLQWVPTDPDPEARASIDAWGQDVPHGNLQPAVNLDTRDAIWEVGKAAAILCANMMHISPWDSSIGLFRGADCILLDGGVLVTYGPYIFPDVAQVPSNVAFDASLREQNPHWGVRSIEEVTRLAQDWGFVREQTIPMPANNHSIVWRRA